MAFGNGNDQNNSSYTWTYPNNFCGGFAVHAVLEDKGLINGKNPLDIYREIQGTQQIDLDSPKSAEMLLATLPSGNGTAMSLPSSMCQVLRNYGIPTVVSYTNAFYENPVFGKMVVEEIPKIDQPNEYDSLESLLTAIQYYTYHIVLANNGMHWVAIKRISNTSFELYNPGDGSCNSCTSFRDSLDRIQGRMGLIISIIK